jgi:hypothetical protein
MHPMDFFEQYSGLIPRAGLLTSDVVCRLCLRHIAVYNFGAYSCCKVCDTVRRKHGNRNPGRLSAGDLAIIKQSGSIFYTNQKENSLGCPDLTKQAKFVRKYVRQEVFNFYLTLEEDNMFIAFSRSNDTQSFVVNIAGSECALLSGDFGMREFHKPLVKKLATIGLDRKQWKTYLSDREKLYGVGSAEALTRRKKIEEDFTDLKSFDFLPAAGSAEAFVLGIIT